MYEATREPGSPRCYVILDLESAVLDDSGHRRYQQMERWVPTNDETKSRRGYKRAEDPLKTPRWVFQAVVAASAMVLFEHCDGNVEVSRLATFSAPDLGEGGIVQSLFQLLDQLPRGAELVSWAGSFHDLPLLTIAALRNGLSLPAHWRWMAWNGEGRVPHIDLCRVLTGGMKMKPIHMTEYVAALDIPAKITAPPFAVASLIEASDFKAVEEVVEGDVITTALLLVHWRRLLDPRARTEVVQDRILRQVEELRSDRRYMPAVRAHRRKLLNRMVAAVANDIDPQETASAIAA